LLVQTTEIAGEQVIQFLAQDCSGVRVAVTVSAVVVASAAAKASKVERARMLNFMMKVCGLENAK
jgi:hypothetical protein